MKKHSLINSHFAASCYFRSSVIPPHRKALVKITDWCNLNCAHCFVSAGRHGETMDYEQIVNVLIPRLLKCRVISVTLTGGEPFAHPSIINITSAFIQAGVKVTICTNGTLADERQIRMLADLKDVSINVSLDGFSKNSHGKFRGNTHSFKESYDGIKLFARFGILKGILVTPNNLMELDEYVSLCEFAIQCNAQYVLMNPLSLFGRGVGSKAKLAPAKEVMNVIKATTGVFSNKVDLVNIRFPNKELPLASCEAGNIIYVFVDGALTICPYLVFAAQNSFSQHRPEEFIVGNIFSDEGIDTKLDNYNFNKKYKVGTNVTCGTCDMNSKCGKGCPAAIIAQGQRIGDVDYEQCPKFY